MSFFRRTVSAVVTAALLLVPANAVGIGTVTAESGLKLRTEASQDAQVVSVLDFGAQVTAVGLSNGWYRIATADGSGGYVSADYLSVLQTASYASPISGVITGSVVNIRSTPDTSGAVVAQLQQGAEVTITGVGSSWYMVTTGAVSGYVHPDYVEIDGEASTGAAVPVDTTTDTNTATDTSGGVMDATEDATTSDEQTQLGIVTGSVVNMRSGAGTSSSVVAKLNRGTEVTVTGESGGWYAVTYGSQSGYISGEYLRVGTAAASSEETIKLGEQIVEFAKQFLGTKYTYGGSSPSTGFDCSGFVYYVFGQFGYSLIHGASGQMREADMVSKSELTAGDLVFFNNGSASLASHVGIYIGDNQFIHATSPGNPVSIDSLSDNYYNKYYVGSGRVLD